MKKSKTILKFNGLGINNNNQAKIEIYNKNNFIIYKGKTYNKKIILYLNNKESYKLKATYNNKNLYIVFYVNNNTQYTFNFSIDNNITFLLTDYYYSNFKIERGELIICPKQ